MINSGKMFMVVSDYTIVMYIKIIDRNTKKIFRTMRCEI